MTGIILLIIIGLFLFVVEILLIPGVSIAGIAGAISIAAGIVLAYTTQSTLVGHITLIGTAIASVITVVFTLRSRTWKKLMLNTNIDASVDGKVTEDDFKPGDVGITISRLAPMGKARINGQVVEAKSIGDYIEQKTEIEVLKVEGSKVVVKPKT